ncbi:MAG: hypothetical protein FJ109_05320 [Deltaproteobacteria bacterium]|nr:hypothetical protein [Deltaproteobacteria bacterium]
MAPLLLAAACLVAPPACGGNGASTQDAVGDASTWIPEYEPDDQSPKLVAAYQVNENPMGMGETGEFGLPAKYGAGWRAAFLFSDGTLLYKWLTDASKNPMRPFWARKLGPEEYAALFEGVDPTAFSAEAQEGYVDDPLAWTEPDGTHGALEDGPGTQIFLRTQHGAQLLWMHGDPLDEAMGPPNIASVIPNAVALVENLASASRDGTLWEPLAVDFYAVPLELANLDIANPSSAGWLTWPFPALDLAMPSPLRTDYFSEAPASSIPCGATLVDQTAKDVRAWFIENASGTEFYAAPVAWSHGLPYRLFVIDALPGGDKTSPFIDCKGPPCVADKDCASGLVCHNDECQADPCPWPYEPNAGQPFLVAAWKESSSFFDEIEGHLWYKYGIHASYLYSNGHLVYPSEPGAAVGGPLTFEEVVLGKSQYCALLDAISLGGFLSEAESGSIQLSECTDQGSTSVYLRFGTDEAIVSMYGYVDDQECNSPGFETLAPNAIMIARRLRDLAVDGQPLAASTVELLATPVEPDSLSASCKQETHPEWPFQTVTLLGHQPASLCDAIPVPGQLGQQISQWFAQQQQATECNQVLAFQAGTLYSLSMSDSLPSGPDSSPFNWCPVGTSCDAASDCPFLLNCSSGWCSAWLDTCDPWQYIGIADVLTAGDCHAGLFPGEGPHLLVASATGDYFGPVGATGQFTLTSSAGDGMSIDMPCAGLKLEMLVLGGSFDDVPLEQPLPVVLENCIEKGTCDCAPCIVMSVHRDGFEVLHASGGTVRFRCDPTQPPCDPLSPCLLDAHLEIASEYGGKPYFLDIATSLLEWTDWLAQTGQR